GADRSVDGGHEHRQGGGRLGSVAQQLLQPLAGATAQPVGLVEPEAQVPGEIETARPPLENGAGGGDRSQSGETGASPLQGPVLGAGHGLAENAAAGLGGQE